MEPGLSSEQMEELKEKERDKDFTLNLAQEILSKCHPDAVNIIKHWITIIQQRWDEISTWALQRFVFKSITGCYSNIIKRLYVRLQYIINVKTISGWKNCKIISSNSKICWHSWTSLCNG